MNEINSSSRAADEDRPLFDFKSQSEPLVPEKITRWEWNSPTGALTEFLSSLGVSDPGTTARSLHKEFGTLSDLLTASWWRLHRTVDHRLARLIMTSHGLMKAMLEEQVLEGPVIPGSKGLIDLLQVEIGFLKHERLLSLYVDSKCRLMRIERIADGAFGEVALDIRSIIGCALAIGSAGFILVHNHPSGIPQPSNADIDATSRLKRLAANFNLALHDHFIVARGRLGTIEEYWRETRFARGES